MTEIRLGLLPTVDSASVMKSSSLNANTSAQIAEDLNHIAAFLAANDFDKLQLNGAAVRRVLGTPVAEILLLLGNSVLHASESAFTAMQKGIAQRLVISGGKGHSTELLYKTLTLHPEYRAIPIAGQSEAELLAEIATRFYKVNRSLILFETKSSNCGENAEFTARILHQNAIAARTVILVQDPTMQRRSSAALRKVWRQAGLPLAVTNFPTFVPRVKAEGETIAFCTGDVHGLWPLERFLSLVLGEIPRLRDDADGYGPRGRRFIDHVDVPPSVLAAHGRLALRFASLMR
jgi:uncharacterized SAM-binding protein YcdF (DUF218 family)